MGLRWEEYIRVNSEDLKLIVSSDYGSAPLNAATGCVEPWPDNGLWEPAVLAFLMQAHANSRGNCGHKLQALSSAKKLEGCLRAQAYQMCNMPDDVKRNWAKDFLGKNASNGKSKVSVALARKHGAAIQADRTKRDPLYAYDVDYLHGMIQENTDNPNKNSCGGAVLALHALTGKRPSTIYHEVFQSVLSIHMQRLLLCT